MKRIYWNYKFSVAHGFGIDKEFKHYWVNFVEEKDPFPLLDKLEKYHKELVYIRKNSKS